LENAERLGESPASDFPVDVICYCANLLNIFAAIASLPCLHNNNDIKILPVTKPNP